MHKNILLILFLIIIISQELASIPEIIDKGIGNNKSYIVSLTIRLGKNASISQSSEKAFNEAAQTLLKRKRWETYKKTNVIQPYKMTYKLYTMTSKCYEILRA